MDHDMETGVIQGYIGSLVTEDHDPSRFQGPKS